jgi:hypothetical protein
MDIQQLKLLAGCIRTLLQQANHSLGHNQSLDLIGALPGLRNWPEVMAFPDRVAACELDVTSTSRLAFRLKKKFGLELSPQALLTALVLPGTAKPARAPQVWPTGPNPGVYIATSQDAIDALLERYTEATDGALVFAERAGNHWESSIDLGEQGLWSSGLSRVPSGTLIVVGPLELTQQAWGDTAVHLEQACLDAQVSEHRVAILVNTPTPESICEDVLLMVRSIKPEDDDCDSALLGVVTEDGELQEREPFARPRPSPTHIQSIATVDALPPAALAPLQKALAGRTAGLLFFGSAVIAEHSAIDLVVASLAMTEHLGPAARIMPRNRSTPAKDWQVPDAIQQLPFLPSIESAYDQGYRRMVINPNYTNAEVLQKFGERALLIGGAYGGSVEQVFMNMMRGGGIRQESDLLENLIALLGVRPIPGKHGEVITSDLFVMPQDGNSVQPQKFEDLLNFLRTNRILRWEEQMAKFLELKVITSAGLKKALPRDPDVSEFLSQRAAMKKAIPEIG